MAGHAYMMSLIARFLPSLIPAISGFLNPWILLAVAVAIGLAGFKGYQLGAGKLETYRAEQLQEATRINLVRGKITERIVIKYIKVAGKTEYVTRWIEKEVANYENDTACLDTDFRRLHDAAATNAVPETSTGTNDLAGAPPTAAETLQTVAENYARANRTADKLEALQQWVKEQSEAK